MRAIRRFTVRTVLPDPLAPLATIATNLRWSWHPETQDLFARIDARLWDEVGQDPVRLLGEVSTQRWAELAADPVAATRRRDGAQIPGIESEDQVAQRAQRHAEACTGRAGWWGSCRHGGPF